MRISTVSQVQQSQLLHCPVWDINTGTILGLVEQIWIDKQLHQVIGLTYCELDDEINSLPWEQVEAVSSEGIWVNYASNIPLVVKPTSFIHYQLDEPIWTTTRHRLGMLADITFAVDSGEILYYYCVPGPIGREMKTFRLSPRVMNHRCDRWIVDMDLVFLPTCYPCRSLAKTKTYASL